MKLAIRLLVLTCAAALVLGLANAQEPTRIKVVERDTLSSRQIYDPGSASPGATHQLTLTLAYFSDGPWSRNAVVHAARAAGEILAQCGVRLRRLNIVRIDAPLRYRYFDNPTSRELAQTLQLSKPTVYFVTDTRQQPAFDAEAVGRGNSKSRPELADTVWVTRATHDVGIAVAHELVHILTDSGAHVDRPGNLMREQTTPENTHLTGAQCAQLREVGAKNGLLEDDRDSRKRR